MKKIVITGANSYTGMSVENWLNKTPDEYQVETLDMIGDEWKTYDFTGTDVIYHVAGIAHADVGSVTEEQKKMYYAVNTDLAIEVAQAAKRAGVKQFILMSSMIVYGGIEHITRETKPQPANFYGDSKWQADQGVRELEDDAFRVVILRPPMIYGKGSKGNYPKLAKMAKKLPIFPRVNNRRSMLYIDNLCSTVQMIIDKECRGVFFPQNSELVNTSELVNMIAEVNEHKIWITRILAPVVVIGKHAPGKIGGMCNKAFGSSYYDLDMSASCMKSNVCSFSNSIEGTEGVK